MLEAFGHVFLIAFVLFGTWYYTRYIEKHDKDGLIAQSNGIAKKVTSRSGAFDFLKIFLTVLVVCHHAALQCGVVAGGWPFQYAYSYEELVPENSPSATFAWMMLAFAEVNLSFFMPLFFFISGYFTPGSLRKKGLHSFLRDRFYRLGIPCIFVLFVLNPIIGLYLCGFRLSIAEPFPATVSFASLFSYVGKSQLLLTPLSLKFDSVLVFVVHYLLGIGIGFGYMWFAAWLLLLSFVYAQVTEGRANGGRGYVELVPSDEVKRMPMFGLVLAGSFCLGLGSAVFKHFYSGFMFFQMPLLPVSVVHNVGCFLLGCWFFNRFEGHDFIQIFRNWMDVGCRRALLQLSFVGLICALFLNASDQFHEFQTVARECTETRLPSFEQSGALPFASTEDVAIYWRDLLAIRAFMPKACQVPLESDTFMTYLTWCRLLFAGFFLPVSAYVLFDICITLDSLAANLSIVEFVKRQGRYMFGVYIFQMFTITLTGVVLMWMYEAANDSVVQLIIEPQQHLSTLDIISENHKSFLPVQWRIATWISCCICPVILSVGITKILINYVPGANQIL